MAGAGRNEFDQLDTNRDGELDGDEYTVAKLLREDANTDGVLSRDEWVAQSDIVARVRKIDGR